MRPAAQRLLAPLLFALLTLLFTWPLPARVTSGVIGAGAGDNMSFVWDFWWAREALRAHDSSLFQTPALFAPIGTSLAAHTLIPLMSAGAALLLPLVPPLALYNLALLTSVFLNFLCSYAAACTLTRDRLASLFAGVTFGGAPFLLVRLLGHLNVLSAWGLPLLLIATVGYERKPAWASALALAGTIGLLAYTDYYYAIFGVTLLVAHLALSRWVMQARARPIAARQRRVLMVLAAVIAAVCAIIAWIASTGGVETSFAGVRLQMTDTFNPRVALGFLIAAACVTWKWPITTRGAPGDPLSPRVWRFLPAVIGVTALLLTPLLVAGVRLWLAGDYQSQVYFWRSAPPGIDLATFALGNPLSPLNGHWTTAVLEQLGIDRVESAAWIGIAPLALLVFAMWRRRTQSDVRTCLWIGGLFLVWSLGPYLRILGYNTAFMLPQTFMRFVPVLANARIPGRAFVVVQLMVALVGAMALASLRESRRGTGVALLAIAALVVDYWPAPHPWTALDRPAIYDTLKTLPPGVVLEIPVGIQDGFAERGRIDHRVLFYQTIHGHPQMGGLVSRLSSRIKTAYESDPIVGPLLDLSEGVPVKEPTGTCSLACAVRYVVVNEADASEELKAFVTKSFSLRLVERSDSRSLYAVDGLLACSCSR